MLDLKPYAEYKDSELPWLGSIPAGWQLLKTKYLFTERVQKGFPTEPLLAATQTKGVIPKSLYENRTVVAMKDLHLLKLVERGDYVISLRSFEGGIEYAHYRGIISPAYTVLRPSPLSQRDYFEFLFKSKTFISSLSLYVTGIREGQNIDYERLSRSQLPVPPAEEQKAIGRFLRFVITKANQLIRAKRKVIELLNEQEQAIIHRAVTQGLEGSVPLASSGSECWGDVPKHWRVTKLYRITKLNRPIMYGIVLPGPHVDEGVFIVKGGNCEPGRLHPDFLSRTTFEIESKYVRSRLRGNDIVYSIRGSIGAAELVPHELTGANLTQDAARIAPKDDIDPRWLLYAVRSRAFFARLDAGAVGATIRGINIRDLKRADIVIPPLQEQHTIAAYLDRELANANEVVARTRNEIEVLTEYRTRLIADVVTGKLDVRGVKLPELNDAEEVSEVAEEELEDSEESVEVEESVDAD